MLCPFLQMPLHGADASLAGIAGSAVAALLTALVCSFADNFSNGDTFVLVSSVAGV